MITLTDVGYAYRRQRENTKWALKELNLSAQAGEVIGVAGPNGAGKTTLIGLLLGYLVPTIGQVRIGGVDPRKFVEREGMGYLSELVSMPPTWTTISALRRFAALASVNSRQVPMVVSVALERFGLLDYRDSELKSLSKGTLQRVALAQALLQDQRLVIFDEPTHGLDPSWTARFREVVSELRRPERVIVIASHNLDELERLADRVIIIDRGRVQRTVMSRGVSPGFATSHRLVATQVTAEAVAIAFPGATRTGVDEYCIHVPSAEVLTIGIYRLIGEGAELHQIAPIQSSLERHFADVVDGPAT